MENENIRISDILISIIQEIDKNYSQFQESTSVRVFGADCMIIELIESLSEKGVINKDEYVQRVSDVFPKFKSAYDGYISYRNDILSKLSSQNVDKSADNADNSSKILEFTKFKK